MDEGFREQLRDFIVSTRADLQKCYERDSYLSKKIDDDIAERYKDMREVLQRLTSIETKALIFGGLSGAAISFFLNLIIKQIGN